MSERNTTSFCLMIFRRLQLLFVLMIAIAIVLPTSSAARSMQDHEAAQDAPVSDEREADEHVEEGDHEEEPAKFDAVHHNSDAYYLDFSPMPKLELPRIFVVRRADGEIGVDFFGSTHAAVEAGYVAEIEEGSHGGILDAHIVAGSGKILVDMSISKHLFFAWLSMLIVLGAYLPIAGRYKKGIGRDTAPKGRFQNLLESLVLFVRDDIVRPSIGPKADKYVPYLLTVFLFVVTCNLIGLFPFGATATANIMVTAVLAIMTFIYTMFAGTKDYWKHIFWPPGIPILVKPILIPVEILGLFTKPFALAIRLFANMTAGHLVILSLIGLIFSFADLFGPAVGFGVVPISVAFALFIFLLEILVAIIQAYVFTMLSALFIGMAAVEHEHHEDHGHDAEGSLATVEAGS